MYNQATDLNVWEILYRMVLIVKFFPAGILLLMIVKG
jgi:hypothetical protein